MSSIQHRFSDYLQQDLYHSIGAYGVADKGLAGLVNRLEQSRGGRREGDDESLLEEDLLTLAQIAQRYNEQLGSQRHRPGDEQRHPIPLELPLSNEHRFDVGPAHADPSGNESHADTDNSWGAARDWTWVPEFYEAALAALDHQDEVEASGTEGDVEEGTADWYSYTFASNLIFPRDGSASFEDLDLSGGDDARLKRRLLREWRRKRYVERVSEAHKRLSGPPLLDQPAHDSAPAIPGHGQLDAKELIKSIAKCNLKSSRPSQQSASLPIFVLRAHAEAHLCMHAVEAWQSMCLGPHASTAAPNTPALEQELDRCIMLNTFAYGVSRAAPWIFAQDEDECAMVFRDIPMAWRRAVPTRCMWIASQVGLLALHRRAYAKGLKRRPISAYNDYHKLQRLIRDTERRVQSAPIHVDGAMEFLGGLYAQAHHHIGELYRSEHAQKPALKHFKVATHRLDRLSEDGKAQGKDEIEQVLVNSRWRVQLQVSSGKANYELGRHKESLRSHLEAWRSLLCLLAADTGTEASTGEIDEAIAWLDDVRYEPELRKHEVQDRLRPVVDQLDGIVVDGRLATLAAEILLRLGHLLFVLNIAPREQMKGPALNSPPLDEARPAQIDEAIRDTLALGCLRKALQCDPHSTLVGADLLKAEFRVQDRLQLTDASSIAAGRPRQRLNTVAWQWPGGGDDYERIARVTEYLILRALAVQSAESGGEPGPHTDDDARMAQRLLVNFFTHTDSINVRKSQAHRFLMRNTDQDPRPDDSDGDSEPAIELICMRRYSSAFPLLPRPSAFRALGGGYLVRLHQKKTKEEKEKEKKAGKAGKAGRPFGVVVDPGADFVENLYRSGCSLSDVNMIVVTHDHVDHMGALDPLLSLLHERSSLLKEEQQGEEDPARHLTLLVNESVRARYSEVTIVSDPKEAHSFRTFDELLAGDLDLTEVQGFPKDFQVRVASTAVLDGKGHEDLSGKPSYGVCFEAPDGVSVAITGDTPQPPQPPQPQPDTEGPSRYDWWRHEWAPILDADVLIAHLSTVPLTELRQLAGIDATDEHMRPADVAALEVRVRELCGAADTLLKDLQQLPSDELGLAETLEPIKAAATGLATRAAQSAQATGGAGDGVGPAADELVTAARQLEGQLDAARDSQSDPPPLEANMRRFTIDALGLALDAQRSATDSTELESIRGRLQDESRKGNRRGLQGRIEFALWLRTKNGPTEGLLDRVRDDWRPPQDHSYLTGLIAWAREYRDARQKRQRPGLFVVGELSEELGTVRRQVAVRLNEMVFKSYGTRHAREEGPVHALTSDIGLRVFVSPTPESDAQCHLAQVLCTSCNLDTDRVPAERYHDPHLIHEVCVKGENEGIFYNCLEHDPSSQEEHTFLEQLERFDVFGR